MGTALTYQNDCAGIAPLDERIETVRDRVATLAVLAAASAGMGLAEPRIRAFWSVCAVFALVGAAAALAHLDSIAGDRERALDELLAGGVPATASPALARHAERITTVRSAARLGGRLRALIRRAETAPGREVFDTRAVLRHRDRLTRLAGLLEKPGNVPASTAARLRLFLHSPSTPLLARPGDDERFSAWLRPIEHELTGIRRRRG
jgi:hypothetical protein